MRGSVKWYFRCAVKTFLMVAGWSALMWLFTAERWVSVGEESRKSWEIIYYMLLGYIIFSFSHALTFYKRDIPLAVSMGVSRKNAFLGTCVFTVMNFIVFIILAAVVNLVTGEWQHMGIWIGFGAVCVIWANIVGTGLGTVHQVFGKAVAIIAGVVVYILLMAGIFFAGFSASRKIVAGIIWNAEVFVCATVVTLLVWGGVLTLHYKTVKKMTI